MNDLLDEILIVKRKEVETLKRVGMSYPDVDAALPVRDFKEAVSVGEKINLIAEIKFASPSAGTIREAEDPVVIGRMYEKAGAAAISLLTDKTYFRGDLKYLPKLKREVSLPILRKDFILDEIQLKESVLWGADAVLLIARVLSREALQGLLNCARELGLAALVEVHDRADMETALACKADIIGINNRDLDTFEVRLRTTQDLAPLVPKGCIVVSESGIHDREDIHTLARTGIQAVLVGTAIMKSDRMEEKTKELVRAGEAQRW